MQGSEQNVAEARKQVNLAYHTLLDKQPVDDSGLYKYKESGQEKLSCSPRMRQRDKVASPTA